MKKIITTAAIALTCAIGYADVQSANVVGYANTDYVKGWTLSTPVFQTIGLEGYNVQDLKPVGDGVVPGGKMYFLILDQERKQKFNFGWMTYDDDDMDKDGWYNKANGKYANYTIQPGDSVMFYAPKAVTIQAAGQVKGSITPSVMSAKGWYLIGNPSPVEVDIQTLIPEGTKVTPGGKTYFLVLDEDRKQKFNFGWMTYDDDDMDKDGWYNKANGKYANYKIQPGEAVMFYTPTAISITWPNPLPTDK